MEGDEGSIRLSALPTAGNDAGGSRASRLTSTARCAVPNWAAANPEASVRATSAGSAVSNGTSSGTIGRSGNCCAAPGGGTSRAEHASRGDHSTIHAPSGPAATSTRWWRTASVRWRPSSVGTSSGASRRPQRTTASTHSSSSTGQSATTRRHVPDAAGGVIGRGSAAGGATVAATGPGCTPARRTTTQPATCCSKRCEGVGCGASAARSASPPSGGAGGSRRSVPSSATVTMSFQYCWVLMRPPPGTKGRRWARGRWPGRRGAR